MERNGLTKEKIVRRGRDIYKREIRSKVEHERAGEFMVVDVTTGSYEVDESDVVASDRALRKNPNAMLYFLRVGRPAAYRIGAAATRDHSRAVMVGTVTTTDEAVLAVTVRN